MDERLLLPIFKGQLIMAHKVEEVQYILNANPYAIVINMDEEGQLPLDHPNILNGTVLLPPAEYMVGEDSAISINTIRNWYYEYIQSDSQFRYMLYILITLYMGKDIVLFCPIYEDIPMKLNPYYMLEEILYLTFGIGVGKFYGNVYEPSVFDSSYIGYCANLLYHNHTISAKEYLYYHPVFDHVNILDAGTAVRLIHDLKIPGTWEQQINFIKSYQLNIKQNPDNSIIPPIISTK